MCVPVVYVVCVLLLLHSICIGSIQEKKERLIMYICSYYPHIILNDTCASSFDLCLLCQCDCTSSFFPYLLVLFLFTYCYYRASNFLAQLLPFLSLLSSVQHLPALFNSYCSTSHNKREIQRLFVL